MSAVLPPTAPPPPAGGGTGAVVALQVLTDLNKALKALPEGALLDATAQARAAKGVLDLMTAQGPVQLRAMPGQMLPAIPDGARLLLQVLKLGGDAQLNLLAVNGRPLAGAQIPGGAQRAMAGPAAAPSPAGNPGGPVTGLGRPLGALPLAGGTFAAPPGITATLIRPATLPGAPPLPGQPAPPGTPNAATAGLPTNLPAGTTLTVRIAGLTPPMPGAVPASPPQAVSPGAGPSVPTPLQSSTPGTAPAPAPQPTATAPVPTPTPAPASPTPSPTAPPVLQGTVTAHPPGGQAVVQTPIGTLALPTQADLPVGTGLKLEIAAPPQLPAPATAAPAAARPEGLTAAGWPALDDAMATLSGDRQALDLLMRAIPHAGPRLAASLSVFAAAQRSGDSRAVLGEGVTKALDKAGRKDVAERLKADLDSLSADATRPLGNNEWRGYTLPFLGQGAVDPIRLYVRGGGEEDKKRQGGTGNEQRFVLDFKLSNLGRLQLDGLVKREEKLFDLIIRTGAPLAEPVRRDIMVIFADASELAGTKGGVSFQSGGRWVEPLPDQGPTRIEA